MGTGGCKGLREEGRAPKILGRSKAGSRTPESREAPPGLTVPGAAKHSPNPHSVPWVGVSWGEAVECLLAWVK